MAEETTLRVNGARRTLSGVRTVDDVLRALDIRADHVVVELDGDIVAPDRFSEQTVREGARLEIVHFVGGG